MASKSGLRMLVAVLLSCAQAHACTDSMEDGYACAGVGCASGFELLTPIKLPLDVVQMAQIRVCRNSECRTGKFSVDREPGKDGSPKPEQTIATVEPSSDSGPGASRIYVDVLPSDDAETLYLVVSWLWEWKTTPDASHDEFDISIEVDGTTLYKTHRVVEKYEIYQPNGKDPPCGGLTCGYASSIDCRSSPEIGLQRKVGLVEPPDAPAMCPPVIESDTDADAGR